MHKPATAGQRLHEIEAAAAARSWTERMGAEERKKGKKHKQKQKTKKIGKKTTAKRI